MLLQLTIIYPDNFHMCMSIIKTFLLCLKKGVRKMNVSFKDGFSNQLLLFWNYWHVSMLEQSKNFNQLKGKDVHAFLTKEAAKLSTWGHSQMKKG